MSLGARCLLNFADLHASLSKHVILAYALKSYVSRWKLVYDFGLMRPIVTLLHLIPPRDFIIGRAHEDGKHESVGHQHFDGSPLFAVLAVLTYQRTSHTAANLRFSTGRLYC